MNVNVHQNIAYYSHLPEKALCDCVYCKNYYSQVKSAYPEVAAYLLRLGIDIEKPFETSPLEPQNGYLTYCCCQYIAFGSCSDTFYHKIGNVEFRKATSYPNTHITEQHFVLDVWPITLKANFSE
ncbi:hypothetical protein [Faecalimonas sp.]